LDSNSKHKDRRSIVDVIVALLAIAAAAAAATTTTTTTTGSQFFNSLVGVSPYHSSLIFVVKLTFEIDRNNQMMLKAGGAASARSTGTAAVTSE